MGFIRTDRGLDVMGVNWPCFSSTSKLTGVTGSVRPGTSVKVTICEALGTQGSSRGDREAGCRRRGPGMSIDDGKHRTYLRGDEHAISENRRHMDSIGSELDGRHGPEDAGPAAAVPRQGALSSTSLSRGSHVVGHRMETYYKGHWVQQLPVWRATACVGRFSNASKVRVIMSVRPSTTNVWSSCRDWWSKHNISRSAMDQNAQTNSLGQPWTGWPHPDSRLVSARGRPFSHMDEVQ